MYRCYEYLCSMISIALTNVISTIVKVFMEPRAVCGAGHFPAKISLQDGKISLSLAFPIFVIIYAYKVYDRAPVTELAIKFKPKDVES